MERENLLLNLKESDSLLYNEETNESVNYEGVNDEMLNLEVAIALKMSNRMIKQLLNEKAHLEARINRMQ